MFKPAPSHDIDYGVTFSKKYAEQLGLDWQESYIKILDELGIKNIRLVAYWDESEPIDDEFNFDDILWQLEEAKKRDISVIMAIGRKVPRYPECFEPDWWKNLDSEELKKIELYEYVSRATLELKHFDNIVIWQVENEPFFPFGECEDIKEEDVEKEILIVREIDGRPILTQDSGEGGFWYPSYSRGDYLGISMYRRIWYDFWGIFFGNTVYFQYPLPNWTYRLRSIVLRVPMDKIIVTELQAEPWGPAGNEALSRAVKDKTMSKQHFLSTISYAQNSGFGELYLWGVEWWLFEKEVLNEPFFWDTARVLMGSNSLGD